MIVYGADLSSIGYPCAAVGGRCEQPCEESGDPLDVYLDGDWMPAGAPKRWPTCPVRATYDDPDIQAMLHVRRMHALTGNVHADDYAGWLVHLWSALDALQAERTARAAGDR